MLQKVQLQLPLSEITKQQIEASPAKLNYLLGLVYIASAD